MANKNQMNVNGKDVGDPHAYLTINLSDDKTEVRGFGQPVTRKKAKEMAEDYFKDCEDASKIIDEIDSKPQYSDLKNKVEFMQLKSLISKETQTVSGVFGKEIILQILSMRNCEGIRYIYGKDSGKNTIILVGVQDAGTRIEADGTERALSEPVMLKTTLTPEDIPVDGEVHDESLTIAGVRAFLQDNPALGDKAADVIFGLY